jgi:hypothetical protein
MTGQSLERGMPQMKFGLHAVLNFIVLEIAWFACVLGGANDYALAGVLVAGAVIGLHLHLAQQPSAEAWLVAVVAVIGLGWDSLLVTIGLFSYPTGNFLPGFAPYWIVAMWAVFATSLNLSLSWLKGRPWLAALVGLVGGPLSYLAGERLGGVEMSDAVLALGVQALGWAALLPLLAYLATRLNGIEPILSKESAQVSQEAHGNV